MVVRRCHVVRCVLEMLETRLGSTWFSDSLILQHIKPSGPTMELEARKVVLLESHRSQSIH